MPKSLTRVLIISIWIFLLACFLYGPKFSSASKDSINVFTWGGILNEEIIQSFEKKTGIRVNVNNYSSNEELILKLKATEGQGYDLVIPSDYAVSILVKNQLIKELDRKKLPFFHQLLPELLGHFFDPENHYSIPLFWEVYGLGIDRDFFTKLFIPSWSMIFDPKLVDYRIVMVNDPIEAIEIAAFYLCGPISSLSKNQAEKVKDLLLQQKPWVAAYATSRADYFLATKNSPLAVASSSYIFRSKRNFDFIDFVVPKEGSFISIENLCIPKTCDKEILVYQFINHLYQKESIRVYWDSFRLFPALDDKQDLDFDLQAHKIFYGLAEDFKKYHFFKNLLPQQKMRDIWVEIKVN
ncbi:Spermidine/putrescine-binding periplasmic protein [Candidatus Rhabdochlamydia oedothoracis]|uniref:Spermidine/putrescine-binding periplasmic protein n=1 Tax=Candidatus Rhabdochlamydia oedothoracis TaxID=2720720 RepID=A0ABX8V2R8_9BACT|nr:MULTISPECIES: extracellular solute-binding protein [Rhabdochlamydia]KAG6559698.1 Spermidine/putrescine-binding periplasmic protein [Candidatus Rhabdochlamydia sp. W815]QYF49436.1 Spermidine/putrescine-binding periplasmic protein [Candidatus Rhabdochlamydia oedothoracis]